MERRLEAFFAQQAQVVDLPAFLVNLALAGLCAAILASIYRRFGTVPFGRIAFSRNFVLLTMTATMVIAVVKSSLALALGLIGALSIVRFRAMIKEPEELVFLFLCMALGIGFGAGQTWLSLAGFSILIPILIYRGWQAYKQQQILHLQIISPDSTKLDLDQILEVLDRHCSQIDLKLIDRDAERLETDFHIHLNQATSIVQISEQLRMMDPRLSLVFSGA